MLRDRRMLAAELVELRHLGIFGPASELISLPVIALLLMHERIGIVSEFFAHTRMLLQVLLQVRVILHEALIADERRILAKLLGDFRMAIQKLVGALDFPLMRGDVVVFAAVVALFLVHDELHILENLDVAQGIAGQGDDVGVSSGRDHSELSLHIEKFGRAGGGALDGVHRAHAEADHARELLRDGLGPGDAAHVGTISDFDAGLQSLLEADFVIGSAQTVALAAGRVFGRPIGVVDAERRTVPSPLLEHLCDLGVSDLQAVLDGVTAAVKGTLQADAAVGVAGNFLTPAVGLIDDSAKFFDGERGLRDEFAVLARPGAVRHEG